MNLIQKLMERSRPELPIDSEILVRERKFNEQGPSRELWLLSHTYLCEGDLKELEKHPEYDAVGQGIDHVWAYYQSSQNKRGPCKRVIVFTPMDSDREFSRDLVERKLKLALHSRGCNAGVFYKRYQKSNVLYAEAIPATLTGE